MPAVGYQAVVQEKLKLGARKQLVDPAAIVVRNFRFLIISERNPATVVDADIKLVAARRQTIKSDQFIEIVIIHPRLFLVVSNGDVRLNPIFALREDEITC